MHAELTSHLVRTGYSTSFSPANNLTFARFLPAYTLAAGGTPFLAHGTGWPPGSMEVLNLTSLSWELLSFQLSSVRLYSAATAMQNGQILISGGIGQTFDSMPDEFISLSEGRSYNASSSFVYTRSGHTVTLLPSGDALAVGGSVMSGSLELYSRSNGSWRAIDTNVNLTVQFHASVLLDSSVSTVHCRRHCCYVAAMS